MSHTNKLNTMNNLIFILILSASQPILIEKVAILPKGIEIPKGRCIEKPKKKSWYAKYF